MKRQRRATSGGSSASWAARNAGLTSRSGRDSRVDAAQLRDAVLARGAALPVAGGAQLSLGPRVADDHGEVRGDGRPAGSQVAAVEEQRMPGLAQDGGVLVQDAAAHAHELVLRALAEERHLERSQLEAADGRERQERRDLDGRR